MFRTFLLLLGIFSATNNALAEWVAISESDAGVFYIKTESIRKSGSRVTMWELADMASTVDSSTMSYRSYKLKTELDCKHDQSRTLSGVFYSDRMGNGEVVFQYSENEKGDWGSIIPDSVGQATFEYGCGIRRLPTIHKVKRNKLMRLMETRIGDSFVDVADIDRSGGKAKVWKLYNLKSPMKHSELIDYLSMQSYVEFDCKRSKSRTLSSTGHSKEIGEGAVVFFNDFRDSAEWSNVDPDGSDRSVLEVACGRRR